MNSHVAEDSGDLLVARKVRMEFGGLIALDDIDFTVPRGSITSLIGPNGAGKTTFFNMLTGVYTPTSGEIVFDGHESVGSLRTRSRSSGSAARSRTSGCSRR